MQKKIIVNKSAYYQIVEMPLICGDFNAYTIVMPKKTSDHVTDFMIEALRPDGSTVTDTGQVFEDRCEYVIKNSIYAIPGEVRIRIAPLTENGKLTAREICFVALEDFKGAQELPADRIPALTQAVQYAREMGDYAKEQGAKVVSSVAGKTGAVVLDKSDVGLSDVDNTSDVNKPISKATRAALNEQAPKVKPFFYESITLGGTSATHTIKEPVDNSGRTEIENDFCGFKNSLLIGYDKLSYKVNDKEFLVYTENNKPTKLDVGLSSVDNTSDLNKPVSKATRLELDDLRGLIKSDGGGGVAARRYSVPFAADEWVMVDEHWTITIPFATHDTGYQSLVQRLERKKSDGSFANVMIQTMQCDNGDVIFLSDEPFDGRFTLREDL